MNKLCFNFIILTPYYNIVSPHSFVSIWTATTAFSYIFKLLRTQLDVGVYYLPKIKKISENFCTFVSYWYWCSYSYYYLVLFKSYVFFAKHVHFFFVSLVGFMPLYPEKNWKSEWTFWNDGECVSYMKLRLLMNYVPFVRLCTFGWRGIKKCCLAYFSIVDFPLFDHIDWCGWVMNYLLDYYWTVFGGFWEFMVCLSLLQVSYLVV
jgi:hypothetical protein